MDGKRHSAVGIASFAVALVSWLAIFALIVVAGAVEALKPGAFSNNSSPQAVFMGMLYLGCMLANFIGLVIAIPGICMNDTKKLYAVIGLVLNGLTLLLEVVFLIACVLFAQV